MRKKDVFSQNGVDEQQHVFMTDEEKSKGIIFGNDFLKATARV
jgi:hypothetical protein